MNRLTGQDAYNGFNAGSNSWTATNNMGSLGEKLKERIAYDANGNILKYLRKSLNATPAMDSLNYRYYAGTNQLRRITDNVPANAYTGYADDINGQADNNYVYDSIGNLIKDNAEGNTNIKWNVYGKIQEITRTATAAVPANWIIYRYDALGNRISQVVQVQPPGGSLNRYYTWYVRDAQGNILSTYTAEGSGTLASLDVQQEDRYMYGSSRVGSYSLKQSVKNGPVSTQGYTGGAFYRGWKQYELTNHLGNVLAVVSDKKIGVTSAGNSSLIDHYEPEIVSATDYYPFGMVSRVSLGSGKGYRFGFNGKLNDNDVKGYGGQQDYGFRIHDPRVGRFLSVDPIAKEYPELTPYQYASNRPIDGKDRDGLEWTPAIPANGNTHARQSTAMQKAINPKDYTPNPHAKWSYYPLTYPGANTGIAPFPTNSNHFQQWDKPKSEIAKEDQRLANERNWTELGYNKDGSKPPLMKLADNKTWNSFSNNLALPLLEGYGYASGAGELRSLLVNGLKVTAENLPTRLARVMLEKYAGSETLGKAGAMDVFVTDAAQLKGLKTSQQIAQKLTLVDEQGNLIKGPFRIIEFDTPSSGLAQPLNRIINLWRKLLLKAKSFIQKEKT